MIDRKKTPSNFELPVPVAYKTVTEFLLSRSKFVISLDPPKSPTLFFCDLILGILMGAVLFRYSDEQSMGIRQTYQALNEEVLPKAIQWLMGYPAGLKLNSNLSKFVGELYLWLLGIWVEVFETQISPNLPVLIKGFSCTGLLGFKILSLCICLFMKTLMLNFEMFYLLAARLYSAETSILGSLWRLFRGKKWNVLHNRLDSADYTLDQLLLGTVIFTTMMFLLPTVLVYYVLFSCVELGRTVILASLNAAVVVLDVPSAIIAMPKPKASLEIISDDRPVVAIVENRNSLLALCTSISSSLSALSKYYFGSHFIRMLFTGQRRIHTRKRV